MRATRWRRVLGAVNLVLVAAIPLAVWRVAASPRPRVLTPGPAGPASLEPPSERPRPLVSYLPCGDLPIDGDSPLREQALPPQTEGFADRHRLVSTWRNLDDPLDACVHLKTMENGALLAALFVGDRCGDRHVLVRVEKDRAWFRDEVTGDLVELTVRRHPAGKLRPEGPRRLPFRVKPGHWVVPRDTTEWFERRGEDVLEEFTLIETPDGLLVREVWASSPLAGCGIERGDLLKSVNGVAVSSRARLVRSLGKRKLERYEIVIERKGRTITITYRVLR